MSDLQQQLQRTLEASNTIERERGGGGMSRVLDPRFVAMTPAIL
jgi:hypothetical protein